ncbi:5348_t:CDS:2 [Entrophospora sp. SA101]|nr:8204_t:CDS:2 [Entrophospora sp. SA101]CAJ0767932.1 5348_t:CDS:2 [Entrophospora sp. SA101]
MGQEHPWWGNFGGPKQKGIVTYSLSPYQQRPFANVFKEGVFNVYRRTKAQIFYVGVPISIGYLIYDYHKKRHEYLYSKAERNKALVNSD